MDFDKLLCIRDIANMAPMVARQVGWFDSVVMRTAVYRVTNPFKQLPIDVLSGLDTVENLWRRATGLAKRHYPASLEQLLQSRFTRAARLASEDILIVRSLENS